MKTNKEIIKEFRKEFRPEYTGGGSIKNIIAYGKKLKSVKVDLSDVESFILQALDQKEREVREEIVEEIENIKNTQCKSDYHNPDDVGGFYCGCLTTTCDHILSNLKQPKE